MKINAPILSALIALLLLPFVLHAQSMKKPQVIVWGSTIEAFASAVQSARSNVPTLWVSPGNDFMPELQGKAIAQLEASYSLDGGVWMDLLMAIAGSEVRSDSTAQQIKSRLNVRLLINAMEEVVRNEENLELITGLELAEVKVARKGLRVQISNNKSYTVRSLVDASFDQSVNRFFNKDAKDIDASRIFKAPSDLSLQELRTIVINGEFNQKHQVVVFKDLLSQIDDRVIGFPGLYMQDRIDFSELPFRFAYGQTVGATAAYCAFFKAKSEDIKLRKLQEELILYKTRLSPFEDIASENKLFTSLQYFSLAGVFQGKVVDNRYILDHERLVLVEEVEDVFKSFSPRSRIWFETHKEIPSELTWENFLSLIKFISFKGKEIHQEIEDSWSSKFGFEGEFNPEGSVNRYEFAVVTQLYFKPFSVAVDHHGQIVQ
ncbi:MAG TPA: hypothetical protein H9853_11425 [Candidatus Sphingobacterium stercoripullorum]|uniref:FAD dependent oxidoreductase n=1 Tax=Candidatus Sphingobacterium stercoripullorum TaxID=2838759 RepID=A0A9D1WAN1_9SPHI|nr:hypothetical protein [Candidatus Sphingobacterium stercoripullorum]